MAQIRLSFSMLLLLCCTACLAPQQEIESNIQKTSDEIFRWTMVTTWPPNFPILGEGCSLFADWCREMSAGRLDIKVYGGGELVPALEVFDVVSAGTAEMGSGASYYWAGRVPAAQFFASVPFGMNAQQVNAWISDGGGQALWDEIYAPFNLRAFAVGNTGVQMGGWFNKEINSIQDFQGLKMRIPGLGAKVLKKAGGTPILSAGSEIYTNLERGVIDATEWIGPAHDINMGFADIAKYYYSPGWHEPGTSLELMINSNKWNALPQDLKAIIRSAAARQNEWTLAKFESQNAKLLQQIKKEGKVELRSFSKETLDALRIHTKAALAEITAKDADSKKVYDSYTEFQKQISDWSKVAEKQYYFSIQQ